MGKKVRSVLFVHWGKIKSSNRAGKTEEKGNGSIGNRPRPVDVDSFEIRHKPDLSPRVCLNTEGVGVNNDRSAIEDKVRPS